MMPHPGICPLGPRLDVLGLKAGSLLVLMLETPHTLHTLRRSPLCNEFQHLLQWLVVIRMQLQPDIALGEVE
jgi:hypothetical protein